MYSKVLTTVGLVSVAATAITLYFKQVTKKKTGTS